MVEVLLAFGLLLLSLALLRLAGRRVCRMGGAMHIIGEFLSTYLPALLLLGAVYLVHRTLLGVSDLYAAVYFALGVFVVARFVVRIGEKLLQESLKGPVPQLVSITLKGVVYTVALLIVLARFHVEISPLLATLGIGGLAIGLALQNTLSNFFAGVHILSDRPISVGDWILLDNQLFGRVEDIGWRSTRIRTLENSVVVVPNARLAESLVVNYGQGGTWTYVDVGVAYTEDLERAEKIAVECAKRVQRRYTRAKKEPFLFFREFGDSNINFRVYIYVPTPDKRLEMASALIKEIKAAFDREGIEISWPVRKVYIAGGRA